MENHWASENLQIIRTLMERAAVYRRALAPIMTLAGVLGLCGAAVPFLTHSLQSTRGFALGWMVLSVVTLLASLLKVRQQALRDQERFWSPPTRQVARALAAPFFLGLILGCLGVVQNPASAMAPGLLAAGWIAAYGCALHAAGFFAIRSIRWLGWFFILGACGYLALGLHCPVLLQVGQAHLAMGTAFGLVQLLYGIALCFTEKSKVPS